MADDAPALEYVATNHDYVEGVRADVNQPILQSELAGLADQFSRTYHREFSEEDVVHDLTRLGIYNDVRQKAKK